MIKAGIIGGAGYTAGELLRILLYHPDVTVAFVQSQSHKGVEVTHVHHDLLGETNLKFVEEPDFSVDVLFLCSGHGKSRSFLEKYSIPEKVKIIDLSTDFRMEGSHPDFVYGLPERYKEKIALAKRIANPGCFATAIELAFLPLAEMGLITEELNVTAITGSTGAGQSPTETTHFSWKNNNIAVYKAFEHQHLGEIEQTLSATNTLKVSLNFIPVRGNFSRGIMAIAYTTVSQSLDEIKTLYKEFYKSAPFVVLSESNPDVKQVVNTNKCVLYLEKHGSKLMVISVIDNLLKGASGQAVQNMNLMCGLNEKAGLSLKPIAF